MNPTLLVVLTGQHDLRDVKARGLSFKRFWAGPSKEALIERALWGVYGGRDVGDRKSLTTICGNSLSVSVQLHGSYLERVLDEGRTLFVVEVPDGPESLRQDQLGARLIVLGPNVRQGVTWQLVDATDLYATIAKVATGRTYEAPGSISFAPVLYENTIGGRDVLFAELTQTDEVALRDERWKLHLGSGEVVALYDLESDVHEEKNLVADGVLTGAQRAVVDRLLAMHP